jgi:hypothetical protein
MLSDTIHNPGRILASSLSGSCRSSHQYLYLCPHSCSSHSLILNQITTVPTKRLGGAPPTLAIDQAELVLGHDTRHLKRNALGTEEIVECVQLKGGSTRFAACEVVRGGHKRLVTTDWTFS